MVSKTRDRALSNLGFDREMGRGTELNTSTAILDENRDLRSLDPSYALSDVRDPTTGPMSKETRAVSPQNSRISGALPAGPPP